MNWTGIVTLQRVRRKEGRDAGYEGCVVGEGQILVATQATLG